MTTLAGKGSLPQQETNITKTEIVSTTKDGKPKHTTTTRKLNRTAATTHQTNIIQVVIHQDTRHMNRSSLLDNTDVCMWITKGRTILKNHHPKSERGPIIIGVTSINRLKARDIILGTTDSIDLNNTASHLKTFITRTIKTLATSLTGDHEAIHVKGKYR